MVRDLLAGVTDGRTWRRILYLVLALPLGTFYFCVLAVALSTGLGLIVIFAGVPMALMITVWRGLASFERRLLRALLGLELPSPYRPRAPGGFFARLMGRISDPATWKDLGYLVADFPLGIADATVAIALPAAAVGLVSTPLWYWAMPDGIDLGLYSVDTLPEALITAVVGVLLVPVAIRLASAWAGIHAAVARALLTASPDPELAERVREMRSTSARLVAAADAERARLERDLHDGAQQRLVALALQLRLARDRLARGDDALDLVTGAGDEAQLAIKELRDLARGIHPAVLTERGPEPAIRDLANRATVPVEIGEATEERFPAPVEATAYFVVSEALANVAKYAEATHATVATRREGDRLVVEITDDGAGGADPAHGSGLRGLMDRVGALDGDLSVESPPGAGTRIRTSVPVGATGDTEPEPERPAGEPLLDERAAALVQVRRQRAFAAHAAVFAVIELSLVVIWLATGAGYFWPGWSIFGWGVLLALHGALLLARPPLSQATVDAVASARRGDAFGPLHR